VLREEAVDEVDLASAELLAEPVHLELDLKSRGIVNKLLPDP